MTSELERFRLLDQARQRRVLAHEFRKLLAIITVSATFTLMSGIASDLEGSARELEAKAMADYVDDGR
jgi:hypothetical protein